MMQYPEAREVFKSALHILCSNGSFNSRLEKVIEVTTNLESTYGLPKFVIDDFNLLKQELNLHTRSGLIAVSSLQLNRMQRLALIENIVSIYKQLVEHAHDDYLREVLKQIEDGTITTTDESMLNCIAEESEQSNCHSESKIQHRLA
ncbi:hypothetical protein [uncultured Shewanella sp.]|uniref:hypothetical protein n=1 Tax=uncultured Shewanella sp. TaxID=173975 RepID=UPI002625CDD3|nr:hypothetical protein [uncultured Shewanella sp.]